MSKFFPFPVAGTGLSRPVAAASRRSLIRAALFLAALALLWLAMQLMPAGPPDATRPPVYSDASGTVAASPERGPASRREVSVLRPGYVLVLLLLGGGLGLAYYLRRRSPGGAGSAIPLRPLGQLQLAPQQQLRLVACGDDVLLLGVTTGQITLLKTYPRETLEPPGETTPTETPGIAPGEPPPGRPFAELLETLAQRPLSSPTP
ncbi:MAG: hypothetical protein KatS3mg043_0884 [Rhodothermaceae bacterium]|nr:MAG: hypothetical protein KatS3mg043_0884 [Rhodothermaceae bacterium]